jgi:hypothetical protein
MQGTAGAQSRSPVVVRENGMEASAVAVGGGGGGGGGGGSYKEAVREIASPSKSLSLSFLSAGLARSYE